EARQDDVEAGLPHESDRDVDPNRARKIKEQPWRERTHGSGRDVGDILRVGGLPVELEIGFVRYYPSHTPARIGNVAAIPGDHVYMSMRYGLSCDLMDVETDVVAIGGGLEGAVEVGLDGADGRPNCGLFFGREVEVGLGVA